jgi:16S rRNA (adenine1518-N6/adenine1519-N6)-dimethyltransferase
MKHPAPRKQLGQHFLTDTNTVGKIIDGLSLMPNDRVLEIGPGRGALTGPLHERLTRLWAIELDRELAPKLVARFAQLTLFNEDALDFNYPNWATSVKTNDHARLRVVGNLPYNVATPLIFRFVSAIEDWHDLTVMVQKEVADRMLAKPSTPAYGRLSVSCQFYFTVKKMVEVRPGAFFPPPKVMSTVLQLVPQPRAQRELCDPHTLELVVKSAFAMRRKKISNTLKGLFSAEVLQSMGIADLRAENLSLAQYIELAQRRDAGLLH